MLARLMMMLDTISFIIDGARTALASMLPAGVYFLAALQVCLRKAAMGQVSLLGHRLRASMNIFDIDAAAC